ncbi:TIR domain-containing protein [Massilia rubra]|uniref:TIR domain-containing protein n=1 Tax=Massilia rubra TaxID=2607910 RepID=UPI00351D20E6
MADGFLDGSVFESSKRESADALKRFLREGLKNSSVTCVLVGAQTSERRWVRFEIAQSILKGNGLLSVDIHLVENNQKRLAQRAPTH